jgi:hypothetical protein
LSRIVYFICRPPAVLFNVTVESFIGFAPNAIFPVARGAIASMASSDAGTKQWQLVRAKGKLLGHPALPWGDRSTWPLLHFARGPARVNHSYHHPYVPGRPLANNFLLTPGFDMQSEILDTERLLIANGETPSIFFRFPGLVSDAALMQAVRRDHLVVLGADGWLVFAPPLRQGAILLIHPNGNEHPGLRLFVKLLDKRRLPRPFRRINDAP